MTEVINRFPGHISIIYFIRRNLRHCKICLRQNHTLRIDSNKNFRYTVNIQIFCQRNNTNAIILYCPQPIDCVIDFLCFVHNSVFLAIFHHKRKRTKGHIQHFCNIRNPFTAFLICGICHFKYFVNGVKRNTDPFPFIVAV